MNSGAAYAVNTSDTGAGGITSPDLSSVQSHPKPPAWLTTLLGAALVFPWISPLGGGPHVDMVQRLTTLACGGLCLGLGALACGRLPLRALARTAARTTAAAWLVAALLSAVMALLQYFDQVNGALADWIHPSSAGNAFANLRQRNQFASLTSIGLASLLWMAQWPPGGLLKRWAAWRPPLMAAAVLLLAAGNAASSSRTGALQWLLLAGLALWWDRHGAHDNPHLRERLSPLVRWSLLALGLYVAANWLMPLALQVQTGQVPLSALERFNESAGNQSRLVLWANVLELIAQKPWLGWGWGELKFAHFIHAYPGPRFNDILDNAHNLPLHLAVELGLPAALLLCGAPWVLVLRARPWGRLNPTQQLGWSVLLVLALHSLLEYPLWYGPFQLAAVLAVGLLCGRSAVQWRPVRMLGVGRARVLAVSAAALLLAGTAYAAWDYWRISQLYLPPARRAAPWRDDTYRKVHNSVLFQGEVRFALVTTTPVEPHNADALYAAALQTLHFSPEPKVLEVLLTSAALTGREGDFTEHIRRQWLAAYPDTYPAVDPPAL